MKEGDFSEVAGDYAAYRDMIPDIFFAQLEEKGVVLAGRRVIDLGCGTGLFTRALASRGAAVTGIDPSEDLLDIARKSDPVSKYRRAHAETFPIEEPADLITVLRAWHWFDRTAVLRHIAGALAAKGMLLVVNSVYLPESPIVECTYRIARSLNIAMKAAGAMAIEGKRINGFPAVWFDEWQSWGFAVHHAWEHDYQLTFTPGQWAGKVRSVSWMAAAGVQKREAVTRELLEALGGRQSAEYSVPHKYSAVLLVRSQPEI